MKKTCTITGCTDPARVRGMCNKHYKRWRKHGDPTVRLTRVRVQATCDVEGCGKPVHSGGLCPKHRYKVNRYGDPHAGYEKRTGCQMTNCGNKHEAHGLCQKHYLRWLYHGDPWFDGKHYPECEVEGCYRMRTHSAHWCPAHQHRVRNYGDPLAGQIDSPMGVALSLYPLEEALTKAGGLNTLLYANGIREDDLELARWEKAIRRARERGSIDAGLADKFAVKLLGSHPALVWGEEWWDRDQFEDESVAA